MCVCFVFITVLFSRRNAAHLCRTFVTTELVVVLTLTHRYDAMRSVVAAQAPITLERKITSGGKQKQKTHNN